MLLICEECFTQIDKDTFALNKKLLGNQTKQFLCLKCLGEIFDVTEEDLRERIQLYKDEGCGLFV